MTTFKASTLPSLCVRYPRCELLDACPVSHVDEAVVVNHRTAHKFACPKTTAEVELSCGTAPLPPLRLIAALTDPASVRGYLQESRPTNRAPAAYPT